MSGSSLPATTYDASRDKLGDGYDRITLQLVTIVFLPLTLVLYAIVGDLRAAFSWLFSHAFLTAGAALYFRRDARRHSLVHLIHVSYYVLTCIGLLIVASNRINFGTDFGSAADDSRYYAFALESLNAHGIVHSLYDWLLGFYCCVVQLFLGDSDLLHLLPFNWALGAASVGLAHSLALKLTSDGVPLWLTGLLLLGNSHFTDSTARLYRDGLVLCFMLSALLNALDNRLLRGSLMAAFAGLVRGANGLISLLGVAYFWLVARQSRRSLLYPAMLAAGVISLALLSYLPSLMGAQLHLRLLSGTTLDARDFEDWHQTRADNLLNARIQDDDAADFTLLAQRSPLLRPLAPVLYLLAPVSFKPMTNVKLVVIPHIGLRQHRTVRSHYRILEWVTILLWIIVGPPVFYGLWRGVQRPGKEAALVLLFLTILLGVSFISFQQRHKTALLVLLPALAALGLEDECSYRRIAPKLRVMTFGVVVVANVVRVAL